MERYVAAVPVGSVVRRGPDPIEITGIEGHRGS